MAAARRAVRDALERLHAQRRAREVISWTLPLTRRRERLVLRGFAHECAPRPCAEPPHGEGGEGRGEPLSTALGAPGG